MNKNEKYQYFKIAEEYNNYKGVRYFRVAPRDQWATQVCLNAGEERKGRNANYGITLVSRLTLYGNYVMYGYAVPCSKKLFENAMLTAYKALQ